MISHSFVQHTLLDNPPPVDSSVTNIRKTNCVSSASDSVCDSDTDVQAMFFCKVMTYEALA